MLSIAFCHTLTGLYMSSIVSDAVIVYLDRKLQSRTTVTCLYTGMGPSIPSRLF